MRITISCPCTYPKEVVDYGKSKQELTFVPPFIPPPLPPLPPPPRPPLPPPRPPPLPEDQVEHFSVFALKNGIKPPQQPHHNEHINNGNGNALSLR